MKKNLFTAFFLIFSVLTFSQEYPEVEKRINVKPKEGKIIAIESKDFKSVDSHVFRHKKTNTHQPLFVLDGKIISFEALNKIDPKSIERLFILKNKDAIDKYGKKGINGVIEVISKNSN